MTLKTRIQTIGAGSILLAGILTVAYMGIQTDVLSDTEQSLFVHAIPGEYYKVTNTAQITSSLSTLSASCDSGDILVNGGFTTSGGASKEILGSFPTATNADGPTDGWVAKIKGDNLGGNNNLIVTALCQDIAYPFRT